MVIPLVGVMGEKKKKKSLLLKLKLGRRHGNYEAKEFIVSMNVLTSQQEEEENCPNSIIVQSTSTSVSSQPKRHIKKICQRGLNTREANGLPGTGTQETRNPPGQSL